jgi:hypothetical protein
MILSAHPTGIKWLERMNKMSQRAAGTGGRETSGAGSVIFEVK